VTNRFAGFDVAMDDAARVRGLQRHRNLHAEVDHLVDRQRTFFDSLLDRPALQELHDDEGTSVLLTELVNGADVGVRERGGKTRFALEARQPGGVGVVFLAQELDRHLAIETEIFRAIDDTHAALAELVEHAIVGNDRLGHKYVWKAEFSESVVYQLGAPDVEGVDLSGRVLEQRRRDL
jgi:hypothetical protein